MHINTQHLFIGTQILAIVIGFTFMKLMKYSANKPSFLSKTPKKEKESEYREWYHKCQHCKYSAIQGTPPSNTDVLLYCLHGNNTNLSNLYRVKEDYYCAKWEMPESFSIERLEKSMSHRDLLHENQANHPNN